MTESLRNYSPRDTLKDDVGTSLDHIQYQKFQIISPYNVGYPESFEMIQFFSSVVIIISSNKFECRFIYTENIVGSTFISLHIDMKKVYYKLCYFVLNSVMVILTEVNTESENN